MSNLEVGLDFETNKTFPQLIWIKHTRDYGDRGFYSRFFLGSIWDTTRTKSLVPGWRSSFNGYTFWHYQSYVNVNITGLLFRINDLGTYIFNKIYEKKVNATWSQQRAIIPFRTVCQTCSCFLFNIQNRVFMPLSILEQAKYESYKRYIAKKERMLIKSFAFRLINPFTMYVVMLSHWKKLLLDIINIDIWPSQ